MQHAIGFLAEVFLNGDGVYENMQSVNRCHGKEQREREQEAQHYLHNIQHPQSGDSKSGHHQSSQAQLKDHQQNTYLLYTISNRKLVIVHCDLLDAGNSLSSSLSVEMLCKIFRSFRSAAFLLRTVCSEQRLTILSQYTCISWYMSVIKLVFGLYIIYKLRSAVLSCCNRVR